MIIAFKRYYFYVRVCADIFCDKIETHAYILQPILVKALPVKEEVFLKSLVKQNKLKFCPSAYYKFNW